MDEKSKFIRNVFIEMGGEIKSRKRIHQAFYLLEQSGCGLGFDLDFDLTSSGSIFSKDLDIAIERAIYLDKVLAEQVIVGETSRYTVLRISYGDACVPLQDHKDTPRMAVYQN